MNVEYFDFFSIVVPLTVCTKSFFEFLNVFVVEVIVVARFFLVIRESDKAVVLVERGVKYTSRC